MLPSLRSRNARQVTRYDLEPTTIRKPENSQSRKLDFDGSELSARLFMPVLKHNSLLEEGCYRPIKIRNPARSARIPMTLFGITKRTISGSPCKISQSASNIIPTDMLSLLFFCWTKQSDRLFFLLRDLH